MPRYQDTRGKSTLAVAICDRCRRKLPRANLGPDPNSPGLMVCEGCTDQFDPYRLASRKPESIVVDNPRLDVSLVPTDATVERLTVSGPNILDPSGQPIILRGFSWGRFGSAQPQDAGANLAQGANCVRIPLRWWGYYGDPGSDSRDNSQPALLAPRNLAILDAMIQWASDAGLWIILFIDSDCGQNGTQNSNDIAFCDPAGQYPNGHNFWTDLGARMLFMQVWQFIANRYKDTPRLGLFEALPEPNPTGFTNADIANFYRQVIAAIRLVETRVPFLIGADAYNPRHLSQVFLPERSDVVYTGNLFMFTNDTQANNLASFTTRLQGLIDFRASAGAPVWCNQTGVVSSDDADYTYEKYGLNGLVAAHIGFARWLYRDNAQTDSYGLLYIDSNGNEVTKTARLAIVSAAFKAPA